MMDRFISMRLNDAQGFTREIFFFGAAADGSWSARGGRPRNPLILLHALSIIPKTIPHRFIKGMSIEENYSFLELTFRNKNSNEGMVKTITRYHNRFAAEEGVGRIISIG
jgi:hypothetical protein